jgi:hypothetical protein
MTIRINSETHTHAMSVTVDGASYRVHHITSPAVCAGPSGAKRPAIDSWRVWGRRGVFAERECDCAGATFRRVVEAVKAMTEVTK